MPIDSSFDLNIVDEAMWPNWKQAKKAMHIIDQEEGETIFV